MAALAAGTNTQVLIGGTSSPAWTNISGLTVSAATSSTTVNVSESISGTYYLVMSPSTTTGQKALAQNSQANAISYVASTGVLTATGFSGSGNTLTNLNASNVASGTLPGDRGVTAGSTSASFLEYNGTTATAGQLDGGTTAPSGTTRLNYGGYLYATRFYGDGSNLTALTAGNLSGTIPALVLGNSSVFIGTTSVALNRTTGNLALGGITSITGGTGTTDLDFFTAATTAAASGAIDLITGATTTSGTTGAIIIRSGNSAAASGALTLSTGTSTGAASGAISIDTGATSGGSTGAITIGTTSASALTIGRSGVTTSIIGNVTTTLGKTTLAVHATGYAALNIPSAATVVSSPASGDIWNLSGVLQFNTGAATKQIAFTDGNITGSAATAGSVTNSFVLRADGGTTEGTDLYTFNGSAGKNVNLVSGTGIALTEASGAITFTNSGVTSLNGSTGVIGASANTNGSFTRYHRATTAAATTTTINHGLGQWVLVQVYKTSDGTIVDVDVTNTADSGGRTVVGFAVAPASAGDYTVVIIG